MAATPAPRMTRRQILDAALARVGNMKLLTLARTELNRVLENLYLGYLWPFLQVEVDLSLSGTSFPLPSDFLQTYDPDCLVVTAADGVLVSPGAGRIREVDRRAFQLRKHPSNQTSQWPQIWHADRARSLGLIWPTPSAGVSATLRYKYLPADVPVTPTAAYDADVPVFLYHSLLIDGIYVWGLGHEEDEKYATETVVWKQKLDMLRQTSIPPLSIPDADLDPDVFTATFSGED